MTGPEEIKRPSGQVANEALGLIAATEEDIQTPAVDQGIDAEGTDLAVKAEKMGMVKGIQAIAEVHGAGKNFGVVTGRPFQKDEGETAMPGNFAGQFDILIFKPAKGNGPERHARRAKRSGNHPGIQASAEHEGRIIRMANELAGGTFEDVPQGINVVLMGAIAGLVVIQGPVGLKMQAARADFQDGGRGNGFDLLVKGAVAQNHGKPEKFDEGTQIQAAIQSGMAEQGREIVGKPEDARSAVVEKRAGGEAVGDDPQRVVAGIVDQEEKRAAEVAKHGRSAGVQSREQFGDDRKKKLLG